MQNNKGIELENNFAINFNQLGVEYTQCSDNIVAEESLLHSINNNCKKIRMNYPAARLRGISGTPHTY